MAVFQHMAFLFMTVSGVADTCFTPSDSTKVRGIQWRWSRKQGTKTSRMQQGWEWRSHSISLLDVIFIGMEKELSSFQGHRAGKGLISVLGPFRATSESTLVRYCPLILRCFHSSGFCIPLSGLPGKGHCVLVGGGRDAGPHEFSAPELYTKMRQGRKYIDKSQAGQAHHAFLPFKGMTKILGIYPFFFFFSFFGQSQNLSPNKPLGLTEKIISFLLLRINHQIQEVLTCRNKFESIIKRL